MYPEEKLVKGVKTNEVTAFNYLYDFYAPALLNVISRLTNDKHQAEDILQEVFCKAWQQIDTYDASKGRLFTWLVNISKNATIDWRRSKRYKYEQITFSFSNIDSGSYCINHYLDAKDIRKLVDSMSGHHRSILELFYVYGFSHQQIAQILHIPLGTVKSRLRYACERLRVLLIKEQQSGK